MKSPVIAHEIKWLVAPTSEFTDNRTSNLCQPVTVPMPLEIGRSSMVRVHLPLNIELYAGSHRFAAHVPGKLVPYARFKAAFAEPLLMINALKTGRAVMTDDILGEMVYGAVAGTLLHHILEIDRSVLLDMSGDIDFTSVGLGYTALRDLLGETTAQNMLDTLGIAAIPSFCVAKLPRRITAILHSCLPGHLTGEIGILYAQAKILEFLCELAGWLDTLAEPPELQGAHRELLQHLHGELSALAEGKVPTLSELSEKYGKSGRVLNQGFRELYGCSIYTFVSEQRLIQAHEALVSTDAPMKAIAANLGYTHVTNFMSAFRKKFGYPPGSLRK